MTGDRPGEFTEQQEMLVHALYGASLQSSPIGTHMASWLHDWRIGDVVVEMSTRYRPAWQDRIGVMTRVYDEPLFEEDGITQFATRRHWVLTTNAGTHDWHNAGFLRVPTSRHQIGLFEGRAPRCTVFGDCNHCARETWRRRPGWEQVLRTEITRKPQPGEAR